MLEGPVPAIGGCPRRTIERAFGGRENIPPIFGHNEEPGEATETTEAAG